jgi:Beta/Gamma crystallin.
MLTMLILAVPPVAAAGPDQVKAVLDGERVSVAAAAAHHCHDLDAGVLECFTSEANRDSAVAAIVADHAITSASELGPASTGYVIAWEAASFAGASTVLSQDYPNLTSIGWNDRISSYKVYTTYTGAFYDQSYYQGLTQFYCCFAQVSYVGNQYNDIFSSFNLP